LCTTLGVFHHYSFGLVEGAGRFVEIKRTV
jgi:hypothetical protein